MQQPKPIYSKLDDDLDVRPEIHDFVVDLAEAVDLLQDLHADGALEELAARSLSHADRADRLGYPDFATVARQIARSAEEGKLETSEDGLRELTDIACRIRLGHRGAA